MEFKRVQVFLAVRDAARSGAVAQALLQAGGTVSIVRSVPAPPSGDTPCLAAIEIDGDLDELQQLRARYPDLAILVLLAEPSPERTAAIQRLDVEDIWKWPFDPTDAVERAASIFSQLCSNGHAASDRGPRERDTSAASESPAASDSPHDSGSMNDAPEVASPPLMVGDNPRMAEIRDTIEKVSGTDVTVLVRGESGVGKDIVARLLFEHSRRRQKPLVKVNCAAIPHDLLESELFGYEAGAFTGAIRSKPGRFELANQGTLFLDEIAEMHPSLQAKLLHVLQDGRFSRLGAKHDISVDVRVICATNKPLEERVREGLFREDLLYRINVVTIFVPPLRDRRDEIPILTDYLLRKYAAQYGRPLQPFGAAVSQRMLEYDWPGNIRELENLCKRFVLVGSETQIFRELSSRRGARTFAAGGEDPTRVQPQQAPAVDAPAPAVSGPSLLEIGRRAAAEAERRAILGALEATHWNRREAARRLRVSYKALLNKIKQMNLDAEDPVGTNSRANEKKYRQ